MKSKVFQNIGRNRRVFRKGQHLYWDDLLIWLNHLNYSCKLIESVHRSLVTWLNWLKPVFKLYRFMVIESIHFHLFPRLHWLIWHELYANLVPFHFLCSFRRYAQVVNFKWLSLHQFHTSWLKENSVPIVMMGLPYLHMTSEWQFFRFGKWIGGSTVSRTVFG